MRKIEEKRGNWETKFGAKKDTNVLKRGAIKYEQTRRIFFGAGDAKAILEEWYCPWQVQNI